MQSYLLVWNPQNPKYNYPWHDLPKTSAKVRRGTVCWDNWSIPRSVSKFRFGDRLFLLKEGRGDTGIIGSAVFREIENKKSIWFTYDALLNPAADRILTTDELQKKVPTVHWTPQPSGDCLKDNADTVESLWRSHLNRIGANFPLISDVVLSPEELAEDDADGAFHDLLPAGSVRTVTVNAYERNRKARDKCIAHHTAVCGACDLDFSDRYGELGKGFIHVHHTKPLSRVGINYKINPIRDLVPVCPNCHAMLHRPPGRVLTVRQLRGILQRKRRGK